MSKPIDRLGQLEALRAKLDELTVHSQYLSTVMCALIRPGSTVRLTEAEYDRAAEVCRGVEIRVSKDEHELRISAPYAAQRNGDAAQRPYRRLMS